jgi:hypothetical protein
MTVTNLGGGGADKFLGAYVKNVSSSLGLSTSPSTVSITVVEDVGSEFQFPTVGSYHTINLGTAWSFSGILTRYEIDIANISGRTIRISLSDPREIMKSVPMILAPGSEAIVNRINSGTGCSVLDIYGAYGQGLINLSGWNQSGMPFERILSALDGDNILFGTAIIPIFQQIVSFFGERYIFDLSEVAERVNPQHRINTNLVPLSNLIEDLSQRHSFDWYINSEILTDGIIKVTVKIIDRSVDNIDIDLQTFLNLHADRVITATSGVELRNEVSCMALQGAPVESLTKVAILGLANEPIDLTTEGGYSDYLMEEEEMLVVLNGRTQWEIWLGNESQNSESSSKGMGRYGPGFGDDDLGVITDLVSQIDDDDRLDKKIVIYNRKRRSYLLDTAIAKREAIGKVFKKLEDHAAATYGKRFVHDNIYDEIIQSSWTRDIVSGNNDPNEYFRQEDGRTKAYVEYSMEDAGGAFSLGLSNLTNLFGNQDIFRNVTAFGTTFANKTSRDDAIIVLLLANNFDSQNSFVDIKDTANYIYKESTSPFASVKTSLYVSCTVNKDGVVNIPGVVSEPLSDETKLATDALAIAIENGKSTIDILNLHLKYARFYGRSLWGTHVYSYQPKYAYIPTRSRTLRYGPVFSTDLGPDSQGKLQIIQDDGFAPWEFGSISNMIAAMQIKVDNGTSLQTEAFTANIQVEGYPLFNIGDSLEKNSNINSISISYGDGIKTTYSLQTYFRKFGEISKQDLARLAFILNNGGGRILPQQQANFISGHNVNVDKGMNSNFGVSKSNLNGGALDFG